VEERVREEEGEKKEGFKFSFKFKRNLIFLIFMLSEIKVLLEKYLKNIKNYKMGIKIIKIF